MGAREDLLAAVERAADSAKTAETPTVLAQSLASAKMGLEAVSLLGPAVTPDAFSRALEEVSDELKALGVWEDAQALPPVDFLRAMLRGMQGLGTSLAVERKKAGAFDDLAGFAIGLAGEISRAADERHTPVDDPGRRLATRIFTAVERAREGIGSG